MSGRTTIQWTDTTWNPVAGCTRVSEGCDNCYAALLDATRLKHTRQHRGLAVFRVREFPQAVPRVTQISVAEIIALVACPNCSAKIGNPCGWFYGIDESVAHPERWQAWRDYHEERAKLKKWNEAGKA